jgi:hypothetical protein
MPATRFGGQSRFFGMVDLKRSPTAPNQLPPYTSVVLLLIFWMIAVGHAEKWASFVWMGDDLFFHHAFQIGNFTSTLWQALAVPYVEKYRPVFSLYLLSSMTVFRNDISSYILTNTFFHALNSLIFFYIAFKLSGKQFVIALFAALAFCWSRFSLYQIGQVLGALEALALLFFLLSLLAFLRATTSPQSASKWLWLSVIASLLSVNTHERYILAPLFFAVAVWSFQDFRDMGYRRLATISGSFLVVVVSNILIKTLVIHMPFLSVRPASILISIFIGYSFYWQKVWFLFLALIMGLSISTP